MAKSAYQYILGLDFETANRSRASACSMGLCLKKINGDIILEKEILIDPETEFLYYNSMIHKITPDMVSGCENFTHAYHVFCNILDKYPGICVVAHNASFDISVWLQSCIRYGLTSPRFYYVCTLNFARKIVKQLPSYTLDSLAAYFNLPAFEHHNALSDAKTTVRLYEHLYNLCDFHSIFDLTRKNILTLGAVYKEGNNFRRCHSKYGTNMAVESESATDEQIEEMLSKQIERLEEQRMILVNQLPKTDFGGKTIAFTGALKSMTREEAKLYVESNNGIFASSLTKKVNILVCGYQDPAVLKDKEKSAKVRKAEEMVANGAKLEILTEQDFLETAD